MPKNCKADEILNPATNRCVKKTGKIGKELLKSQKAPVKPKPIPKISPNKIRQKSPPRPKLVAKSKPIPKTGKKQTLGKNCQDGSDCNTGCCINNKCAPKAKCKAKAKSSPKSAPIISSKIRPKSAPNQRPNTIPNKIRRNSSPNLDVTMFKNLQPQADEFSTWRDSDSGYTGGTPLTTNIMAHYLTKRNPNLCFVFDKDKNVTSHNHFGSMLEAYKWWIHITVSETSAELTPWVDIGNIRKLTKQCFNSKARFFGFCVFLDYPSENIAHVNMLVYDRQEKTLELFEPHGDMYRHSDKIKKDIDKTIIDCFHVLNVPVNKYYKPLDFCPRINIQKWQDRDRMARIDDKRTFGFCAYWSFWWIELRAKNPDIPNDVLIRLATDELKKRPESITDFIHKFAVFVTRVKNNINAAVSSPKHIKNLVSRKVDMYAGSKKKFNNINKRVSRKKSRKTN